MVNKKLKTAIFTTGAVLGTSYVVMSAIAKKQRPKAIYDDKPEEKNPMEGKKVKFVENEAEPANADGKNGHLEAVGTTDYKPTFYAKYVKRGLDKVLSFGGLVVLSPVLAAVSIAVKKEDPGPAFFKQQRVGEDKQYFQILKVRSMKLSTPSNVPTHMLGDPDQYILKSGKIIRKFSLD